MSKIVLNSKFVEFATTNYPGRIYGEYDWDYINKRWVRNINFFSNMKNIIFRQTIRRLKDKIGIEK